MPNDLDSRRRAIARAFRATARTDDVALLQQAVATLTRRLDELTREVDALRSRNAAQVPTTASAIDEEPPNGRVSVPPVTPAKLSNHAFDVLLGTVSGDAEPQTRIA